MIEINLNTFSEVISILIFPGILFCTAFALVLEWLDRKTFARIQHRKGPSYTGKFGILQPVADILKLMGKEDVMTSGADKVGAASVPILQLVACFYLVLFVPMTSVYGLISLPGDLLFVLFVSTFFSLIIIFAGYFSANRFAMLGSERAGLLFISYEIPLFISLITPAIIAKSLQIGKIVEFQAEALTTASFFIYILLVTPSYILFVVSIQAKLEKVPFDVPEAESEIIAGWTIEYTGKKLGMFRLGNHLQQFFLLGLGTALFFGGPVPLPLLQGLTPPGLEWIVNLAWFSAKMAFALLTVSIIRSLLGRFRIDQIREIFWRYLIPAGIVQLIVVIIIMNTLDPFKIGNLFVVLK